MNEPLDDDRIVMLIDRVLGGEAAAWTELFGELHPHLERAVRAQIRRSDLGRSRNVDDHVANVTLDVLERVARNDYRVLTTSRAWRERNPGLGITGWILTIARNVATDYIQQQLGPTRQLHIALGDAVCPGALMLAFEDDVDLTVVGVLISQRDASPIRGRGYSFRDGKRTWTIALPSGCRVTAIDFEYRASEREARMIVRAEDGHVLGEAVLNRKLNQHQLNTLATVLPPDDLSPAERPAQLVGGLARDIVDYAGEHLPAEQFLALCAWLADRGFGEAALAAGVAGSEEELERRGQQLVRAALGRLRARFRIETAIPT